MTKFLLFPVFAFSITSHATNWVRISEDNIQTLYVDTDRIAKREKAVVYWTLIDYKNNNISSVIKYKAVCNKRKKIQIYDSNNYVNSLYLRFEVKDKPGVLSQITKQLAKYKISIQRLIQIPDNSKKKASIIIITHNVKEYFSKKCLNSFSSNKNIIKKPIVIRLF